MSKSGITTLNEAPFKFIMAGKDGGSGDLGRGYNSVNGNFFQYAIDPPQFSEDKNETEFGKMERVKSHFDLLHMINMSASASFSGFGGGANASMSFAHSVEITQDSYFVAANLYVTKLSQVVQYPAFTKEAAQLLADKQSSAFLKAFGDQYCSEVTFGGQLIMLFRFYAETLNEQQSLDVQMSGSFGGFSGASALSDKVKKLQSTETINIQVWMTGQTAPLKSKPDEVSKFIESFPTTITDKGYVVQRKFLDYSSVVKNLPARTRAPDLTTNKQKIGKLAHAANKLDDDMDILAYVKSYPSQFKIDSKILESIPDTLIKLKAQRGQVEQVADEIMTDPIGYNKPLPNLDIPEIPLPPTMNVVPITVEVNSHNKTVSGDGSDWTGQPKLAINWLRVKFVERFFNRPDPPIVLQYNAITQTGGLGWDHKETNWIPSTTSPAVGHIYGIAFKLSGPHANLYDVEYTGLLENGTETPPAQNGNFISNVPSNLNISPTPPGCAICQLKLRITSKT